MKSALLDGNGLPERWRGRDRFVVLQTGFGTGHDFLATWDAWQRDPNACGHLYFIALEPHPISQADLAQVHRDSALAEAWPPLTPNLHRLDFAQGRVQLLLMVGDVVSALKECVAEVDAFFLDDFAPAQRPKVWPPRLFKSLARLAAPNATLAASTAAPELHEGLTSVGFEVQPSAVGSDDKPLTVARFAPAFTRKRIPLRGTPRSVNERRAVIVGAGLAGCAAAWALAEQGWRSVLLDRHAAPAQEASGNPGGLFHGIVNPQDGTHARFNRAAALEAQRAVAQAITEHGVSGSAAGLLRLNTGPSDVVVMRAMLARLGLPPEYVQAVDAAQASAWCGWPVAHAAWFYPGGGWVDPAGLARAYLERAAPQALFVGGTAVDSIHRVAEGWQLRDAQGHTIEEAETVVLANAGDALRLLGHPAWPIEGVRGQISIAPTGHVVSNSALPLSGAGYLLPAVNGRAVFGATSQPGDMDPTVRDSDHADNLARLAQLRGAASGLVPADLAGRTAWRWMSSDRLPVVGAVPEPMASGTGSAPRLDQPRFVPRQRGLFVFTALGSRGITWSALGAQVLASAVSGAPMPLESSLLDAIDPGRFVSRAFRQRLAR